MLIKSIVFNYMALYKNALSCGFSDGPFYYNSKAHGEVDFLVILNNEVLPIEIKFGKNKENQLYNHASLNKLLKMYKYPIAYVFGESNIVKESENVYQLPIYMIDFVRKNC